LEEIQGLFPEKYHAIIVSFPSLSTELSGREREKTITISQTQQKENTMNDRPLKTIDLH
jgi:hypothetical protein